MLKQKLFSLNLLAIILAAFVFPLNAQYKVERGVFGNGGGINASTNNYLIGTLGQTFVGVSASSANEIYSGFWYANQTLVDVSDKQVIPKNYELYQNFPNPFNPTTKIKYSIPSIQNPLSGGARGGLVSLKVYDILGREVKTLVNEVKSPGNYEVNFSAIDLASGVYFYRLQAGNFVQTNKMILMK